MSSFDYRAPAELFLALLWQIIANGTVIELNEAASAAVEERSR